MKQSKTPTLILVIVFCFLLSLSVAGQVQAQTPRAEFEAATLKWSPPAAPGEPLNINLGTIRNGRVTLGNVTLADCIKFAYGIVSDSLIAGPDWINSSPRFDIVAQAPENTSPDQIPLMVQALLADRLKLQLHHEQRPLPYVALVVGRSGVKLGPANPSGTVSLRSGRIVHNRMSIATLATLLSRFERQVVLDRTNLTGFYEVKLEWVPDALRERALETGRPIIMNGETIDTNGPSLVTALSEQLGLRFESSKGPVDVLVIDRAEKVPAEPARHR